MNLQEALTKLYSLHQFGVKLGLDKVEALLKHIGDPQKELKCFHIGGSNGKGSTASFMASILQEAGYKVGLYTSPHFVRFNERIRVNGKEIEDEFIANFIYENNEYIDEYGPTFFEITTALAFKYFAESELDYAVIEVGLGGRLDATNVLTPSASVITSIGLEHTNILGTEIEKIAYEKAGIIKPYSKVFVGRMADAAKEVIKNKAFEVDAEFYDINSFLLEPADFVRVKLSKYEYNIYSTPLRGYYQLLNSALAILTLDQTIGFDYPLQISSGIRNVSENTGIQGRYEIYHDRPRIIFDAAHNLEGIDLLLDEFRKEADNYEKRILIFGVMRDKSVKDMLKRIAKNFDEVYFTNIDYERSAKISELIAEAKQLSLAADGLTDPADFIEKFKLNQNNECLVVTGSIYVLGDIKAKLLLKRT
jgi:dihydrofolate synthase/folylpolyglutamate synthase